MTKEELDKKIKSFSENNGLGKTYNRYELSDSGHNKFSLSHTSTPLPPEIKIRFRKLNKTAILFSIVLLGIVLLTSKAFPMGGTNMILVGRGIVIFFLGLSLLSRFQKKEPDRILILNKDCLCFNKDIFHWENMETAFLKKDLKRDGALAFLWLGVVLKNGDTFFYGIPLVYSRKKIIGGLKLEELLVRLRENKLTSIK